MQQAKFDSIVAQHGGTVTARSDWGQVRVEFPISTRAAGFYDEMITRGKQAELTEDTCKVIVQL